MKFCCASNAAIKNVKILEKNNIYFWILEVLPVILTTYLPV